MEKVQNGIDLSKSLLPTFDEKFVLKMLIVKEEERLKKILNDKVDSSLFKDDSDMKQLLIDTDKTLKEFAEEELIHLQGLKHKLVREGFF